MTQITIDDFAKCDIRIGTILSVEVVPDTDKLLKLSINVGEALPRQILSGIRAYVGDPVRLVGMQVPVLTNLTPRIIRGLESNGMILAGSSGESFTLLTPESAITPGAEVR
jgi:methionyl-tRNA synthetase